MANNPISVVMTAILWKNILTNNGMYIINDGNNGNNQWRGMCIVMLTTAVAAND